MMRDFEADRKLCEAATVTIPGISGYEVDALGQVWSVSSNWRGYGKRIIVPVEEKGYKKVRLVVDGKRKKYFVHRLICTAYHGIPDKGLMVRHLNGIKTDNRPQNLAWGTHAENQADSVRLKEKATGIENGAVKNRDKVSAGVRRWIQKHPEKIRRGESCYNALFANEEANNIRGRYQNGESVSEIAKSLGVKYQTVYGICRGRRYVG